MMRKKCRTCEEKKKLNRRLSIIEGQVRGIKKMIDEDRYCNDILIQVAAVIKSLKSVKDELLKQHITDCVSNDLKNDHLEIIEELIDMINRFE